MTDDQDDDFRGGNGDSTGRGRSTQSLFKSGGSEPTIRDRLAVVTAKDVDECRALFQGLETARICLGLERWWSSLQSYFGRIPRCVKAVGGKGY